MQLGFIGTGEITSSIVTGLCSFGTTSHSIRLSPRNAAVATELSNRFKGISVASSNQEVLDHSDTIVIAVRPAAARVSFQNCALVPTIGSSVSFPGSRSWGCRGSCRLQLESRGLCHSHQPLDD